MNKTFFLRGLILLNTLSYSMEKGRQEKVVPHKIFSLFQTALQHQNDSTILDGYMVYRYDGTKFVHSANVFAAQELTKLPKRDLEDLMEENYIPIDYFRILNVSGKIKQMGALIVGSKDETLIQRLITQDLKSSKS